MLFSISCQPDKLIHASCNCSVHLLFGAAGSVPCWSGHSLCSYCTDQGFLSAPGVSIWIWQRNHVHTFSIKAKMNPKPTRIWGSVCISLAGMCSCLAAKCCQCVCVWSESVSMSGLWVCHVISPLHPRNFTVYRTKGHKVALDSQCC